MTVSLKSKLDHLQPITTITTITLKSNIINTHGIYNKLHQSDKHTNY